MARRTGRRGAARLHALSVATVTRRAGGRPRIAPRMRLAVNAPLPQGLRRLAAPVGARGRGVTPAAKGRHPRGVHPRLRVVRGQHIVGAVARRAARRVGDAPLHRAAVPILPEERELIDLDGRPVAPHEARVGVAAPAAFAHLGGRRARDKPRRRVVGARRRLAPQAAVAAHAADVRRAVRALGDGLGGVSEARFGQGGVAVGAGVCGGLGHGRRHPRPMRAARHPRPMRAVQPPRRSRAAAYAAESAPRGWRRRAPPRGRPPLHRGDDYAKRA